MIVLSVTSYNGAAVNNIAPVSFDELGGTIGRADTNQLVLPDPERTISRVHAQLVFRGGHYALVDRGSNAVLHNGQPIGNGREVLLVVGDDIQIGGYLIAVSNGAAPKAHDPFADFDGDAGVLGSKAPAAAPPPPFRSSRTGDITASPAQRPAPPPPAPAPRAAPLPPPPAAKSAAAGIPDDWDPFRPDPPAPSAGFGASLGAPAPRPPAAGHQPNPLMDDLPVSQPGSEQSLDALFGLSGGAPSGGDPLAGSSLLGEHPIAQPNTAASGDPMQALLQSAKPGGPSDHDHASDMQAPWHQGRAVPAPEAAPAPPPFVPTAPAPLPGGAVLSWDQPAKAAPAPQAAPQPAPQMLIPESATIIARPPGRAPAPAATPVPAPAPVPAPQPMAAPAPVAPRTPDLTTPVPPPFSSSVDSQQLLQAFLQGLGAPDLRMAPLTPESMRQLGELVREAAKGTVELLAARTALKKEVRAEVTVMVPNRNNALKFSPTVEFALQYLLGPPTAGFMGPVDSMQDAYDSLRAHQLGVMAGMRGALAEAVKRFEPAQLEKKLGGGAGGGLLPSSRKAKLWELFQEQFPQLSRDVEEDFDELFGKAFERYVAQLNATKKN